MALSESQFVLLVEDAQQQNFIYHWLRENNVPIRKIRKVPLPAGKGAGEQYVRQKYAAEVQAHRSQKNHLSVRLCVFIDADTEPVSVRHQQLNEVLKAAEQKPREKGEGICLLVPKRNVETWIHHINVGGADEEKDFKPKTADECHAAVKALAQAKGQAVRSPEPPSLTAGREELAKL